MFQFLFELLKFIDKHLSVWSKLLFNEVNIINTTSLFEENSEVPHISFKAAISYQHFFTGIL